MEGTDANGKKRDVTQPTLEPPLGSGPYKVASFKAGSEVVWERVADYWGADLPINIGRHNFDRRRYVYFTDQSSAFQAFTKGGIEDVNSEPSAKDWMTKYKFPAVEAGDVVRKEFAATSLENFQGYIVNMRRPLFADRNVRRALTLAYDFETPNKILSFGLNKRVTSYFMGGILLRAEYRKARSWRSSPRSRINCPRSSSPSRLPCPFMPRHRMSGPICVKPSRLSERPVGM